MAKSQVFFSVGNLKGTYQFQYDCSQLHMGSIIYVTFDSEGKPQAFSPIQTKKSVPHCVMFISFSETSEWHVMLQDHTYYLRLRRGLVKMTIEATRGCLVSNKVIEKAIEIANNSDIRLEHLYKTKEFENSRLNLIFTVIERLDLCKRLQISECGKHLWGHYNALSTYLLLTCFDRLGQPADWLPFESWLTSSKKKKERDEAVKSVGDISEPIEVTKFLKSYYNAIYGVKSSFFNFIHNLLPPYMRKILLNSIKISLSPYPLNKDSQLTVRQEDVTDEEKERYLYQLRNDYTHKATSVITGLSENSFPEIVPFDTWHCHKQYWGADSVKSVYTFNWPAILEQTVRSGLAKYLVRIYRDTVEDYRSI